MRKLDTKHWSDIKKLDGLLFFAQIIDEMLFTYTLDTYKPLALNSRLLCIEALDTIDEIQNGYIPKKNIQSVLEELKWSLSSDTAAKKLLGSKFDLYLSKIKPNDTKLQETKSIVHFIYNALKGRIYLNQIQEILKELVKDGKNKAKIIALTGSFLSELLNYGYHPNHLYYQNFNFFFNSTKRTNIKDCDEINDFFKIFDFKEDEYTVVFLGSIIFRSFRNTLNSFNIVVTKNYNCFSKIPEDLAFKESRKEDESFVICSKVNGLDHHSARKSVEMLLARISSIFNFYHHKEKPTVYDKCIVNRNSDNYLPFLPHFPYFYRPPFILF